MAEVVGVVFRGGTKIYHFDPAGLELSKGDRVVVQTINGPEIGQVVEPPHEIDDTELSAPLKKVVRLATGEDLENLACSACLRKEALETCRRLIQEHGLDMKLVDAEIAFGGEKITFNFVAEERVDFRALVADLARTLKMRVELRQIGAREEARLVGGLGPCGRLLCCTLLPLDEDPVSIRMAKEQNLPLNPSKISGLCGRLMCCLKFEQEQYVDFRKQAPPKGTPVVTPHGEGVVAGYNFTKESLIVRLADGVLTNVRLSTCEIEDGKIVVVPEAEEPVPVPWLDSEAPPGPLAGEEEAAEVLPVVEADVVLGADGEPVEVIVAEGSRRSGSARRRRRKRKSRAKSGEGARLSAGAAPAPESGSKAGEASQSSSASTTAQAEKNSRKRRPGRPPSGGAAGAGDLGSGAPEASGQSRARKKKARPRPETSDGGSVTASRENSASSPGSGSTANGGPRRPRRRRRVPRNRPNGQTQEGVETQSNGT